MVYRSVGFSFNNILAGFISIGETYLQILVSFTKRIFNWFFELFDSKVVPNAPDLSTKPPVQLSNNRGIYHPQGLNKAWRFPLPDLVKFPSDLFHPTVNINVNYLN